MNEELAEIYFIMRPLAKMVDCEINFRSLDGEECSRRYRIIIFHDATSNNVEFEDTLKNSL